MGESFAQTTERYERWLETHCRLVPEGLAAKREKMGESAFAFVRGTFYRWAHAFAAVDPRLRAAPSILSVGDVHLENFGTWRDAEGRLVWGVNDCDEAAELPFTSDLVRLATSALLEAGRTDRFKPSRGETVEAILGGYRKGLRKGGRPFVLEDRQAELRDMGAASGADAKKAWKKYRAQGEAEVGALDPVMRDFLLTCLPSGATQVTFWRRLSGLGSLGRVKVVATAEWSGGWVAREAKAAAPSAVHMDDQMDGQGRATPLGDYRRIEALSIRARDPFLYLAESWIVRRLSPEADKIEVSKVEQAPHQEILLQAMGRELANVHLGTAGRAEPLQRFLDGLGGGDGWLLDAAEAAAERVEADYEAFRAG